MTIIEPELPDHIGQRPSGLVSNSLEIVDVLKLLESIQQGLLDKVAHDQSPGPAVLDNRPLQGFVHPDVDLHLSHLVLLV